MKKSSSLDELRALTKSTLIFSCNKMGQWPQKDIFFESKKVFFCYFKIVVKNIRTPSLEMGFVISLSSSLDELL